MQEVKVVKAEWLSSWDGILTMRSKRKSKSNSAFPHNGLQMKRAEDTVTAKSSPILRPDTNYKDVLETPIYKKHILKSSKP